MKMRSERITYICACRGCVRDQITGLLQKIIQGRNLGKPAIPTACVLSIAAWKFSSQPYCWINDVSLSAIGCI